jgi:hypothetical protein
MLKKLGALTQKHLKSDFQASMSKLDTNIPVVKQYYILKKTANYAEANKLIFVQFIRIDSITMLFEFCN